MNKFALVATLLLATTTAHAGNSISFEVNGHRIRVEAPRNCQALVPADIWHFRLTLRFQIETFRR